MEKDPLGAVVSELRKRAASGENAATLLRLVQQLVGKSDCKIISVQCFYKAFGGGVADVAPVAGWSGFGGELNDARVNALLEPVLRKFREQASK